MVKRPITIRIRVTHKEKYNIYRLARLFNMDVNELIRTCVRLRGNCIVCGDKVWFIADHLYYAGNWVHLECLGDVTVPTYAPEPTPHGTSQPIGDDSK